MIKGVLAGGVALAAGALLSGSVAVAQTSYKTNTDKKMETTSSSSTMLSSSDTSFLKKAAEGGAEEVDLGTLAKDKAMDPAVKAFGEKMVTDHTKANDELKTLADQKGVNVSLEPDPHAKAEHDRLAGLSGTAFDRAYMKLMVSDHEKDVSEFAREARSAKNSDVRAFASKTLPTLREHLKLAEHDNSKIAVHRTKTTKTEKSS